MIFNRTYDCRFKFLDPQPLRVQALTERRAVAAFLQSRGGLGKGNFGRCVVVSRKGVESLWSFIRTGPLAGILTKEK